MSFHDWENPTFLMWRELLAGETLDEFCDEVRADNHPGEGGACWDIVNDLAQILADLEEKRKNYQPNQSTQERK